MSFFVAVVLGSIPISLGQFGNWLVGSEVSNQTSTIISQIRLPRALLAASVGAMLAICGAATQGLFRNPLADPSLIGVTAGASAGAALVIFFGHSLLRFNTNSLSNLSLVSIGAFIGGSLTALLVYRLASNRTGTSVATMLLAGIAITALAGGLTSLLEFFANNEMLRRISLWRMGGFGNANWQMVIFALISAILCVYLLMRYSDALNALLLGESEARHLGIAVQSVKLQLIVVVAAAVGISVSLAGSIAFVGLVVPHIMRLIVGPNHRLLLPSAALGGAVLMLLADTVARISLAPTEIPVGIITALLGAPFFVSLLRYRHSYSMR
ncbi:MAG: iron ABC transporter permease [Acidiferrobacterales bacterium]|nr:iron ABC transporter permease [Acidiferrobacterales bacterium]